MPKDLYLKVSVTQGLAAERTVLAAERTLLAYIRTGLGLLIAGVSGAHFVEDVFIDLLAATLIPTSLGVIIYGISRFRKSRALTWKMLEHVTDPSEESAPSVKHIEV